MEKDVISLLSEHARLGYLILALVAFLETSAFIGLLVPGETMVIVAGVLASQGALEIGCVLLITAAGAVCGDTVSYVIGARYGERLFDKLSGRFSFRKDRLEMARAFYASHGGKAVFFGRFVSWLRAVVPLLAGTSHMPLARFLFFNVYGCTIWAAIFSMLGYTVGSNWQVMAGGVQHLGTVAAVILALAFLVWYLIRKQGLGKGLAGRVVTFFAIHHPRAWAFFKGRFASGTWYGLSLTVSMIVLALATAGFGQIADQWLDQEDLYRIDQSVHLFMAQHVRPEATRFVIWLTGLGSTWAVLTVLLPLLGYLFYRRRRWLIFDLVSAFFWGEIFLYLAKFLFARQRPVGGLVATFGMSFPSGHSFNVMLTFGFLSYVTLMLAKGEVLRFLVPSVSVLIVLGVGFSRVYLGAHWLTDVLGGYTSALAWMTIAIALGNILQGMSEKEE